MQNKRIRKQEYNGIMQTHIKNNLKDYIIVTIIFFIGIVLRCIIYKQHYTNTY